MPAAIPIVAAAGSIYAANKSSSAAKSAANSQIQAQEDAIAEQQRQYDLTRSDLAPYRDFGPQNLAALTKLMNGDYSGFDQSPDYLFARQQAIGASDSSAAARGSLYTGGHSADLATLASGLASQYLNNYRNSLEWGANLGENAAAQTGQFGQQSANAIGDAYGNIGNARAQGIIGSANAWANGANEAADAFGNLFGSSFGVKQEPISKTSLEEGDMWAPIVSPYLPSANWNW